MEWSKMELVFPLHLFTMVSFKHVLENPLASTWLFKIFFQHIKEKEKGRLFKKMRKN